MDKKLFLLDAYALIYRAYYALIRAPRMTSRGFNTSAIFGFVNTLEEVLNKQQPSHIAVCFDTSGPTFRHEAYHEYKAQRDKQPEDITLSIPYIKDIIKAYGIPAIEIPGYEADDVIGTLSHIAEKEGYITYMMTPDKDSCSSPRSAVPRWRYAAPRRFASVTALSRRNRWSTYSPLKAMRSTTFRDVPEWAKRRQ